MSSNTTNLNLYKTDPVADGNNTFNIKTMLNDNWDKIDTAVVGKEPAIATKNTAFNQNFETTATNIKMNGAQAVGTSNNVARADHVHPSDTTKANLVSPAFTGTPTAPTAANGTNSTQLATTAFVTTAVSNAVGGNVTSASKLQTSRSIAATGDANWSVNFDGNSNASSALTLANTGVTAGTYRSVTVNAKGLITGGTNPTTIAGYGITDAVNKAGDTITGRLVIASGASGGISFPDNAFGGSGDIASITLQNPSGGEAQELTIAVTNDADDIVNIKTPSINGFKHNGNIVWHAGNDGPDSGLNADLLDGQHGSYYAPIANPTFTGTATIPTLISDTYKLEEYTINGETTEIYRTMRNTGEYSIFEISAPLATPHEATQTLMLPATDTTAPYFIDFSCMSYNNTPSAMIVTQTRGAGVLPPFGIAFNKGAGRYTPFSFNPDGTFELLKENATDLRKLKLGSYGVLQDRIKDSDINYAEKRYTSFLFNCYLSEEATNTYTPINQWAKNYKIEMNGGSTDNGIIMYEHDASASTFTDANWTALLKVNGTTLTYKGNNIYHAGNKPTASDVGLGNVTNESKATMFTNAALTGVPTAPTASVGTNNTQIATTAFVSTAVSKLVNSALDDDINKVYTTANSGNVYTVTIPNATYTDGRLFVIKFNAASTDAITLNINSLGAKNVIDYNGNQISDVRANLIVNLRYEANSGNFILLGKGGGTGTATSDKILNGYTATTGAGLITGTMTNHDAYTQAVSIAVDGSGLFYARIPKGAYLTNTGVGYPEISTTYANVANAIGLTSSKLTKNSNVLGIQGSGYAIGDSIIKANLRENWVRNYSTPDISDTFMTYTYPSILFHINLNKYTQDGYVYSLYYNGSYSYLSKRNSLKQSIWDIYIGQNVGSSIDLNYNKDVYIMGNDTLYKYNDSGALQWSVPANRLSGQIAVSMDGYVYFDTSAGIQKYDTYGKNVATFTNITNMLTSIAVDYDGNIIVGYASSGAKITKFNALGSQLWSSYVDTYGAARSIDVDHDNNIYCIGDDNFKKYNSQGVEQWNIVSAAIGYGAGACCTIPDGSLSFFYSIARSSIEAYNPSGVKIWSVPLDNNLNGLYFDANTHTLYINENVYDYSMSHMNYNIKTAKIQFSDNLESYTILA